MISDFYLKPYMSILSKSSHIERFIEAHKLLKDTWQWFT